jgi:hypothetical protein
MFDDLMDMEFEDRINGGIDGEDVGELEPECTGDCEECDAREDCEAAGGHPDWTDQPSEDMDGDHTSALASAGFGTDEDYGDWGGGEDF